MTLTKIIIPWNVETEGKADKIHKDEMATTFANLQFEFFLYLYFLTSSMLKLMKINQNILCNNKFNLINESRLTWIPKYIN